MHDSHERNTMLASETSAFAGPPSWNQGPTIRLLYNLVDAIPRAPWGASVNPTPRAGARIESWRASPKRETELRSRLGTPCLMALLAQGPL